MPQNATPDPFRRPMGRGSRSILDDEALYPQQPLVPPLDPLRQAITGEPDPLTLQLKRGAEIPADRARRVLDLHHKTGIAQPLIDRHLDELERLDRTQALDADNLRQVSPAFALWVSQSPERAAVAQPPEAQKLQRVETHLGLLGRMLSGFDRLQAGAYTVPEVAGELGGGERLKEWGKAGREQQQLQAAAYGEAPDFYDQFNSFGDFADFWSSQIAENLPNIGLSTLTGLTGRQVGGAIGAALTSETGGWGVVPGMAIGTFIGAFLPSAVGGMGDVQQEIKDLNPDAEAPLTVILGGSAIGLLDSVTGNRAASRLSQTFGRPLTEKMLRELLAMPLKPKYLAMARSGFIDGVLSEAVPEGLQEIVQMYAGALGANTETPDAWTALRRFTAATISGGVVGGTFEGSRAFVTTPGTQKAWEIAHARAEQTSVFAAALGNMAHDSETFQKLPQEARAFVAEVLKNGPVESFGLPTETFEAYFQKQGMAPEQVAEFLTGRKDALAQAKKDGTDLQVRVEDYVTKLSAGPHGVFFEDEVHVRPDLQNKREVRELVQRNLKRQQSEQAERMKAQGDVALRVRTQLEHLWVTYGGVSRYEAQKDAQLFANQFVTRATRVGLDPEQLLADEPLEVFYTLRSGAPLAPLFRRAQGRQEASQTPAQRAALTLPADAMTAERAQGLDDAFAALPPEPAVPPTPTAGEAGAAATPDSFVALADVGFSPEEVGALQAADLATEGRMSRDQFAEYQRARATRDQAETRRADAAHGIADLPLSVPPEGETPTQAKTRRERHLDTLAHMLTRAGQVFDPTRTVEQTLADLQAFLKPYEDRLEAIRETGRGTALLREIARLGGVWVGPDTDPETRDAVLDYANLGRDVIPKRDQQGRGPEVADRDGWDALKGTGTTVAVPATTATWLGVPGVFRADGVTPEAMVERLQAEGTFGNITSPADLLIAIDYALRSEQDAGTLPGTAELALLGIDPRQAWWERRPATSAADIEFAPLRDGETGEGLQQRRKLPHGAVGSMDANGEHYVNLPGGAYIHLLPPEDQTGPADYLFVADVIVPREQRRQGQGRRLYEAAVGYALSKGYAGLSSDPAFRNEMSDALWAALAREGVVEDRYVDGHEFQVVTYTGGAFFQKTPTPAALPAVLSKVKLKKEVIPAEDTPRYREMLLSVGPAARVQGALVVSTAQPTPASAPLADAPLRTDMDRLLASDPRVLKQTAKLFRSYDLLPKALRRSLKNDRALLDAAVKQMEANLRALYTKFPKALRERAKLWYVGANRIANDLAGKYPQWTVDQIAGVLAVLSPQTDWFQNVSLALRVLKIVTEFDATNPEFSQAHYDRYEARTMASAQKWVKKKKYEPEVAAAYIAGKRQDVTEFADLIGKRWDEMPLSEKARFLRMEDELADPERTYQLVSPEGEFGAIATNQDGSTQKVAWHSYATIQNAISILMDGEPANLSARLGSEHKVRSFFNNISNPWDAHSVTIDTHAVAAAFLQPFGAKAREVKHTMGSSPKGDMTPPSDARTGISGTNAVIAQAYFNVAAELGILPRELQSITWEEVRSVFTTAAKHSTLPGQVAAIVRAYANGEIAPDDFASQVFAAAGAVTKPAWSRVPPTHQGRVGAEEHLPRRPRVPARRGARGADSEGSTGRGAPEPDGVIRGVARGVVEVPVAPRRPLRRPLGRVTDDDAFFQTAAPQSSTLAAFYSRLTLPVRDASVAKAKGKDWKAIIRNAKTGINQDEYAAVGVDLLSDTTTYTRDEVLDFLKAHEITVDVIEMRDTATLPSDAEIEAAMVEEYDREVAARMAELGGPRRLAPDAFTVQDEFDDETGETTYVLRILEHDTRGYRAGDFATREEAEEFAEEEIENLNRAAVENFEVDIRQDINGYEIERRVTSRLAARSPAPEYAEYQTQGSIEGSYVEVAITFPQMGENDVQSKKRAVLQRALTETTRLLAEEQSRHEQFIGEDEAYNGLATTRHALVRLLDTGNFRVNPAGAFRGFGELLVGENEHLLARWPGLADEVEALGAGAAGQNWRDGHGKYAHIKNPAVRLRYNVRLLPLVAGGVAVEVKNVEGAGWHAYLVTEAVPGTPRTTKIQGPFASQVEATAWADAELAVRGQQKQRFETVMFLEEMQPPISSKKAKIHEFEKMPLLLQKNWEALGLRYALQTAAVKGYDRLAWTTGEMQMERWPGLQQKADRILYNAGTLVVLDDEARILLNKSGVDEAALPKFIGEDAARRLLTSPPTPGENGTVMYETAGDGLKVGGEGLQRLYDRDMALILHKLPAVRRAGVKATTVTLPDMQERRVYEGPTHTAAELHARLDNGDIDPRLRPQARTVIGMMEETGRTFEEAMVVAGSHTLAQDLGGTLEFKSFPRAVPGLVITPALREALRTGGQEFFQAGRRKRAGNAPYQWTLFDQPIVVDTTPQLPTRTEMVTQSSRALPVSRVQGAADAAAAMAYLARGAQERLDGLVVDAEGTPLALIGGFKGTASESPVYSDVLLAEALGVPGAAQVWLAHNHPSGNATLSRDDLALATQLRERFEHSGIEVGGLLAIGAGVDPDARQWSFTSALGPTLPTAVRPATPGVETTVPMQEREFIAHDTLDSRPITTPALAEVIVPDIAEGRFGVVFLDTKSLARGFAPLDPDTALALKDQGRARALYQTWAASGATRAMLYVPDIALGPAALNVANALHAAGVEVLDVISPHGAAGLSSRPDLLTGRFTQDDVGGSDPQVQGAYYRKLRQIQLIAGAADFSSLLHEGGHVFLDDLFRDATALSLRATKGETLNDLQQKVIKDAHGVLRWFNFAGTTGDFLALSTDEQRQMHEQWARTFEVYLFTGQAPSEELRGVFATFRSWLTNIYTRYLRGTGPTQAQAEAAVSRAAGFEVKLTPEIRDIMDRLLATDDAIAASRAAQGGTQALFLTQEQSGLDDAHWAAYQATVERASQAIQETVTAKALSAYRRAQKADYDREREQVLDQVETEMGNTPIVIAQSLIRTGRLPNGQLAESSPGGHPLKLSKDIIVARRGAAFLKSLPRPYLYTREGGYDPNDLAEVVGFASGDDLLDALVNAPHPRQVAQDMVDRRMAARGAERAAQDEETVQDITEQALHEHRAEILAAELHALTQGMVGTRLPSPAQLKANAEARVAAMQVRDLQPGVFLMGATRFGKQAFDALGRNDRAAAVEHKINEQSSLALYRAAAAAKERAHKSARLLDEYQTSSGRRRLLLKAGRDYLDQVDQVLERYDFKKTSQRQQDRRISMRDWADKETAKGQPVQIGASTLADARRINYTRLTVDELETVRQTVEHIAHLARLKRHLIDSRDQRDLAEIQHEMAAVIYAHHKLKARVYETTQGLEPTKISVAGVHYAHLKMATIAQLLDGGETGGPMWTYVIRRLNESANTEARMTADAALAFKKLFDDHFTPMERYRFQKKVQVKELRGKGRGAKDVSLTKEALLMIALNWGNVTNQQRLRDGHGWSHDQVEAALNAHLTARDWQFVQSVWDHIDTYWPAIVAKQERVAGTLPVKVTATPFQTKWGEVRGGYFPIMFNGDLSTRAEAFAQAGAAQMALAAAYVHNVPAHGHREVRAEGDVVLPVRLDFGVITNHVQRVVHDLTHHEALIDIGKVLATGAPVAVAIQETLGPVAYEQFRTGLRDVALGTQPAANAVEEWVDHIRNGQTIVGLAWNTVSAALQLVGFSNSIHRVGWKHVGIGLGQYLGGTARLEGVAKQVMNESAMMRERLDNITPDIRSVEEVAGIERGLIAPTIDLGIRTVGRAIGRQNWSKAAVISANFALLARMQRFVDIATYLGEKAKQVNDPKNRKADGTLDEARIIALAEQAVIDAQGSGLTKDLSAVQRSRQLKVFTNFYTAFNVTYNQLALSLKTRGGRGLQANPYNPLSVARMAGDYLMLVTVPAVATHLIRSAIYGTLDDELEDKDKLIWELLTENVSYMLGTMVLVREVAAAMDSYGRYDGPAGTRGYGTVGTVAGMLASGKITQENWLKQLNAVGGVLFHWPAGQVDRTARGIAALIDGRSENPLVLLTGPPPKR